LAPNIVINRGEPLRGPISDFNDSDGGLTVQAIAFDQIDDPATALTDAVMYYYIEGTPPGENADPVAHIRTISMRMNGAFREVRTDITSALRPINLPIIALEEVIGADEQEPPLLDSITGIAVVQDDVTGLESFLWAVTSEGTASTLRHIDLSTGYAEDWGPLADLNDPDEDGTGRRGAALGDLTWNPAVVNPFTGELGA
jgi:hypothetical protein